jgi:hypothetical protein
VLGMIELVWSNDNFYRLGWATGQLLAFLDLEGLTTTPWKTRTTLLLGTGADRDWYVLSFCASEL